MTNVYVLILAIFLSSCVGTVQEAKVKLNSLFDESKKNLDFQGLEVARPVSHNKVELEFTPPAVANPNFKYLLVVNDSLTPIEINPDSLDKAVNGKARYLVDKLYINSKYKFKLRLVNILTGSTSINEKELFAQTFDNVTADFKGVTQVSKINGQSDTSIRVDWASALMTGDVTAMPEDPQYYEVTIIGEGGPEKLNDSSYTLSDKKKIRVPEFPAILGPFNYFYPENTSLVIGSLSPDTEYFVQVRAVHNLYEQFLSDPDVTQIPINKEVNTKFLSIRTDPLNGDFDFNDISFKAMAGNGEKAKTSINLAWNPASGSYVGYRLFYIKCVGPQCTDRTAVVDNNLLTDEKMAAILDESSPDGKFVSTKVLNSTLSNYTLNDLDPYAWYELKLVACRNSACLKDNGDAIESVTQAVRTAPMLAPFSGIISLDQPESATTMDEVNVKFDVPDLVAGYADHLEFFCINPESVTSAQDALNFVQLQPNIAVPNSRSDQCRGLSLCGPKSVDCSNGNFNYSIKTGTNVRIKGVKTNGTRYCFAGFPAIRDDVGHELPVTTPTKDWIIRCITPQVKTPTISQFPGISSTCSVDKNSISVSWQKPTAGIYNGYRVFWRTIDDSKKEIFSYSEASSGIEKLGDMASSPNYSSSADLDSETLTYTLRNLRPGTRYKIGVLTQAATDTDIKWSEYNTRVKDCMTAMPRYKFEEWTRIFAIGAKVDGRFPLATDRLVDNGAYIYEALNHDGVPYELPLLENGEADNSIYSVRSPGHYDGDYGPSNYADDFDGALADLGQGVGRAASNRGIVSLSWKEVTLDFLEDEFKDCQINRSQSSSNINCIPAASKQLRRYGYKIYRSADNRLSWQDVTKPKLESDTSAGSSLIYAKDYSYYKRAEKEKTTERMAFFTDYSVETIRNDATLNSKARIYWYKIIPYFDNKPIALDGTQAGVPNEIKVILPPDNMALMHRWMANRQACNEIERDSKIDKEGNYTCPFNGFGSRPKGFPWNIDNTVIDLGGHMLIDRFELGCNYTRGDLNADPKLGQSEFNPDGPYVGLRSGLAEFKGFPTVGGSDDTTKLFKGCAQRSALDFTPTLPKTPIDPASPVASNYRTFIQGDCVGYGSMTMTDSACMIETDNDIPNSTYAFPGATKPLDSNLHYYKKCASSTPDYPTVADQMLSLDFRKNMVTQSEFAAVLYHTRKNSARYLNPEGPTGEILNFSNSVRRDGKSNTCYINLAAIGPASSNSNWIARWIPLDDFNNVKGVANLTHTTVEDLGKNSALYDSSFYKIPTEDKYNTSRFGPKTKIGRIVSNNSSKLPPISNLTVGMAQSLCSAYEVEVGFSFNGTNFLNLALPKAKRLMGRQELISASAWPDAADNNEAGNFNYQETSNPADPDPVTNISLLEGSKETRFCSVVDKSGGEPIPTHGTKMKPGMTKDSASGGSTLIFTGSAANDGLQNSELCISKYGIQDIVGNAAEITTDKLFCDYRGDQLYFGPTGDTKYDDSVITANYSDSYGDLFWSKAVIKIETSPGVFREVRDGEMWESISPNSGYCSIVDNTNPSQNTPPQNYEAFLTRFKDVNENFLNVLNPDQTLNSSMVLKANPVVQTNIDKLRNGDGSYLNFGVISPGPIMQWNNTLSLNLLEVSGARAALGPYFNPVVGMTMNCPGTSCDYSLDNKLVSTGFFTNNANPDKRPVYPGLKVPYFPVGNSQIFSPGISETTFRGVGGTAFFPYPIDRGSRYSGESVITEVTKKFNGEVVFNRQNIAVWAEAEFGSLDNVPTQYFTKKYFNVARGTEFILTHGGDAMNAKTGRYTMQFLEGDRGSQTTPIFTAGRCGVLIED